MNAFEEFPLAQGLSAIIDPQTESIVNGEPCELMDQVTPITAELLRFWFEADFCDGRVYNFHVGQRTAILNIIYAHEVLGAGKLLDLYEAVASEAMVKPGVLGEVTRDRHNHPKYLAKMATGTGKTWVLNALLVWQYLNKIAAPGDARFSTNFLLVAPGLIVYDRLLDSFMGKEHDGQRDFSTSDISVQSGLFIPDNYRDSVFAFLIDSVVTKKNIGRQVTGGGIIAITNWHLLEGEEDPDDFADDAETDDDYIEAPGLDIDVKKAVESFLPLTPGTKEGNSLAVIDRHYSRGGPLQALKDLPDLVVFNDEAHHIHEFKQFDEVKEVEWQKSLSEIASSKGSKFIQIDFSATPYNEVGSGRSKGKAYFPHIVVDFDLNEAMALGLVKALTLDKRKDVASLPLDFKAERDEQKKVTGLSHGQRIMLRAGMAKLKILEDQFSDVDPDKYPKLLVVCEDTKVSPHVVEFLMSEGIEEGDIMRVDSDRKGDLPAKEWAGVREVLFDVDRRKQPKVIVSVLMLREGFDVNNICVIVPLRSSQASILLEQTVGRGLRLMWRNNEQIDELKADTRERIAKRQEPKNYFDVLFVIEHPAFSRFYEELLDDGLLVGEVGDPSNVKATGDLEHVDLRTGYKAYDFEIPIIVRDADEELKAPSVDPLNLESFKIDVELLLSQVTGGDKFISQDVQTGTQFGDYRVDGGVMSASGYNDYLSRMTIRITQALGHTFTREQGHYNSFSKYPMLLTYRPLLLEWIDTFIRHRMFGKEFDPLEEEHWRVLLIEDVALHIASTFARKLVEAQENQKVTDAELYFRQLSEVKTLPVRTSSSVEVTKCIYPKLPVPSKGGGLEKLFIQWSDSDTKVEALAKVHEYRHDFMRRAYLKADGMPAQYSPDFLVRTDDAIYVVETKAQSAVSDANVQLKKKAAVAWVERINELEPEHRDDRTWYYVLAGEQSIREWQKKNSRASEYLSFARLQPKQKKVEAKLF